MTLADIKGRTLAAHQDGHISWDVAKRVLLDVDRLRRLDGPLGDRVVANYCAEVGDMLDVIGETVAAINAKQVTA